MKHSDGKSISGKFKDGRYEGAYIPESAGVSIEISYVFSQGTYKGAVNSNNMPNGKGTLVYNNGQTYAGDFVDGLYSGSGTLTNAKGQKYVGTFVKGVMLGKGIATWPNGNRYEGEFAANQPDGKGTFSWQGGSYRGHFADGEFEGEGEIIRNGIVARGNFRAHELTGQATWFLPNGDKVTAKAKNGAPHGPGKYIWKNGDVLETTFKDGKGTIVREDGSHVGPTPHTGGGMIDVQSARPEKSKIRNEGWARPSGVVGGGIRFY